VIAYGVLPPAVTPLMLLRLLDGSGIHKSWRPLSEISPNLVLAAMASEDTRFCLHDGFDWKAIRDDWQRNQQGGRILGASTISMQTAKNLFLWPDRSWPRKGLEVYFTLLIEMAWSKQRIMELYLNEVEWAPGVYGAEAASEFHFHKPAEEKIDGKGHDMDAHLVHKGPDGKLMVIAILFDSGKENKTIKTLWDHLPKEKGKEVTVDTVKIDAVDLLPNDKGYYTYAGSLTTPPCSEQVTWYVLKSPVQVSSEQIARFGRLYPNNARPIQPFNDRDIMGTR